MATATPKQIQFIETLLEAHEHTINGDTLTVGKLTLSADIETLTVREASDLIGALLAAPATVEAPKLNIPDGARLGTAGTIREWDGGRPDRPRFYINDWFEMLDFVEVEFYKTGNVRWWTVDGYGVANGRFHSLAGGRVWFDHTGKITVQGVNEDRQPVTAARLVEYFQPLVNEYLGIK